jgi:tripartite-type tricarboxylate transporter receptor subunit TctC
MDRRSFVAGSLAAGSVAASWPLTTAAAESVADFYRGKTLTCYIGYASGGGYDLYARIISRHMQKHIPGNPNILAVNMPGASSMTLGNHLAKLAPRDGTAFGAVNSALVFDPLFNGPKSKAQFKGPDLTTIGNAVTSASVLVALAKAGVDSVSQIMGKGDKSLVIAASTPSGDTFLLPLALRNVLGLRLKIITGYPGTRESVMALETGEVHGRVWDMEGIKAARPQWLNDGTLKILAQLSLKKDTAVPGEVPLATDFAANDDDRKVLGVIFLSTILARPYLAPPGVPEDRVQALRTAFMATMRDPEFLAETEKLQLNIDPVSGEEMERMIKDAYALPEPLVAKVRKALNPEG